MLAAGKMVFGKNSSCPKCGTMKAPVERREAASNRCGVGDDGVHALGVSLTATRHTKRTEEGSSWSENARGPKAGSAKLWP